MLCYTQPLTLTCYTACVTILYDTCSQDWRPGPYLSPGELKRWILIPLLRIIECDLRPSKGIEILGQTNFNLWLNNSIWRREYQGCGVITSETLTLRLKRYYDFACIISCLMESSGLAMLTPPCVGKGTGQISTKFGVKFAQLWVTDPGEAHSQNWLVFTCSELF